MGKLTLQSAPGFNARANYSKTMLVSAIIIDSEISQIFKMQETVRREIIHKIRKNGFDKSQPLVVQLGTNILLDGHTRLSAAKEAGLVEVPVVEMDFDDRNAAAMYAFERQAVRRNLTGPDILLAVKMLPDERNHKGEGRAAEELAERLGLSPSTIYKAKKIIKDAPPEVLKAVKSGDTSIKAGYIETIRPKGEGKPPAKKKAVSDDAKENIAALSSNVLTAHAKIGSALDYINDDKASALLNEAMECLKAVEGTFQNFESGLARLVSCKV